MTTFGQAMNGARNYREIARFTELAKKAGRVKSYGQYLSEVERGIIKPSYETIEQIAEALEVEFYYRPGQGWGWRPSSPGA